ncbi:hypothetical protein CYMTET_22239 [Cymbomonas tetramitiformis]|uniref:Uncharacterized protein n=1 Tax=Cymbomonas tetramitiformis TaxID=36881 RepID=A0AAE0G0A9_9CHLO|nr:hypothetical protein CYMTET_22239 [Cymbomonas tetramitiformis]
MLTALMDQGTFGAELGTNIFYQGTPEATCIRAVASSLHDLEVQQWSNGNPFFVVVYTESSPGNDLSWRFGPLTSLIDFETDLCGFLVGETVLHVDTELAADANQRLEKYIVFHAIPPGRRLYFPYPTSPTSSTASASSSLATPSLTSPNTASPTPIPTLAPSATHSSIAPTSTAHAAAAPEDPLRAWLLVQVACCAMLGGAGVAIGSTTRRYYARRRALALLFDTSFGVRATGSTSTHCDGAGLPSWHSWWLNSAAEARWPTPTSCRGVPTHPSSPFFSHEARRAALAPHHHEESSALHGAAAGRRRKDWALKMAMKSDAVVVTDVPSISPPEAAWTGPVTEAYAPLSVREQAAASKLRS